jgi:hypothetical protein
MVPLEPRSISHKTESARPGTRLTQILAGKAENAKRQGYAPPAFPVNFTVAFVRCGSKGSLYDTLLELARENTRAELTDERNRNVMSA